MADSVASTCWPTVEPNHRLISSKNGWLDSEIDDMSGFSDTGYHINHFSEYYNGQIGGY
jgi:hypothetical protein